MENLSDIYLTFTPSLFYCQGYLFKELEGEGRTKYDRIVAALKDVYNNDLPKDERDGYKVVVSGHSLGGALANLLSFTLSVREGDGDCPLFRYIRAVTFAAPVVGDSNYDKVFQVRTSMFFFITLSVITNIVSMLY